MSLRSFLQFVNIDAFKLVRSISAQFQVELPAAIIQVREMVAVDITMDTALSAVNIDPPGVINGPQVNVMGIN